LLGIKDDGRGNLEGSFLPITAKKVVELNTDIEADVKNKAPRIFEELKREELRFVQILERGDNLLEEKLAYALSSAERNGTVPCLDGKDVFLSPFLKGYVQSPLPLKQRKFHYINQLFNLQSIAQFLLPVRIKNPLN